MQSFDSAKVEVIFIDDSSVDDTYLLKNYNAPFRFKYIYFDEAIGRFSSRNKGFLEDDGDYYFLDAEVILHPDFIARHYMYDQLEDNLVVTGYVMSLGIYTVYERNFNSDHSTHLKSLMHQGYIGLPNI